jgi:hypothetical protein
MKGKEVYMYVLAGVFIVGYFALIGFILIKVIPPENKDIALILFGTLTAGVSAILSYFFGSSKSSADKNDMLYRSTPAPQDPTTPAL